MPDVLVFMLSDLSVLGVDEGEKKSRTARM